ncbi:hypothetical protein [Glaciibacter sp. 2TAF33]|uniref:hypothetical protein n=1 Tax=Glaciibacter sp. 2TAF33 TaxID=3233015 RepID=UPI003F91CE93
MSDTTPNDGNTTPHGDATPEFREPGAIDYEAAPVESAQDGTSDDDGGFANDDTGFANGDGANSAVTADEVHEHRPVTAEPPAVDGVTVDKFGAEETAATAYESPSTAPEAPTANAEPLPAPVAAGTVKRETYVPAATVGGTGAATLAADNAVTTQYPEYTPAAAPVQQTPIYVQAPTPPKNRGNRGGGILIAVLATLVYAVLYAAVAFVIAAVNSSTVNDATTTFTEFLVRPVFYIPVIFFFLAFALLIALVNRGGWWAYVLFAFLVAVVVYFSYIGGALLTQAAWNFTPEEAGRFVASLWLNPAAIAAAVLAREVPIWFGAWIARRGRKVTVRNTEARAEYERQIAEGPQLARPA